MSASLLYRLNQKWKYHFSGSSFEKKVAEINRNAPLIVLQGTNFAAAGSDLWLGPQHAFVVDQFSLFQELIEGRGKFAVAGGDLLYKVDGVNLRITTAEEIFIIHEIFFERCYCVVAPTNYNVIDIGMNVGYASLFFASSPTVDKVHAFEPFKPTFDDATANFELNPGLKPKISAHNFGWSAGSEQRNLHYSPDLKGKNSIHDAGAERIQLRDAFEVLGEVVGSNPNAKFFVKMDCEGAEFEIFDSLKKRPLPESVFGFIIEWHVRDPHPIIDVLIANRFKVQLAGSSRIGLITAFR